MDGFIEAGPAGLSLHAATPATPLAAATLWIGAIGCAAAALLIELGLWQSGQGHALTAAFAALAWLAAIGTRLPPRRQGLALTALLVTVTLLLALVAGNLQLGVAMPGLPVVPLLVCVLCAAAGWRAGMLLASVAVVALAWLALGVPQPAGAIAGPASGLALGSHLIGIGAALAAGALISKLIRRALQAAQEREQRFRSLLALAADAYWQVDADYRLTALVDCEGVTRPTAAPSVLGNVPWELPAFDCDAEVLDELRADLDTRVPFRERPLRWRRSNGQLGHFLASGAPRFDARGVFLGYWGVVRDTTEIVAARSAVAATETRYQELFSSIPTPLVLHRRGAVLDANSAAVSLFGFDELGSMLGTDLLAAYEGGDSRERARRRTEALHAQPLGTVLPVTDFKLRVGERMVAVRATSVSVQADGGPALLAIFVDDTERLAAEQAVRRSEAMLSHLVATSPDLITLTDLATGRYAMVNRSFERISGWSAAEVVGRTASELGVWPSAEAREHLVQAMRQGGSVSDFSTSLISRQGGAVPLRLSAARFVMDRREYMVVNARDISDPEQQRLQREAILTNASIGIALTHEGRIVLANRHCELMLGYDAGELLGMPAAVVWTSEAEAAELRALIGPQMARGEPIEIERTARRKDGGTLAVRLRGRVIDPERPLHSDNVWIIEDITERRRTEQALAQARDDAEAANRAKSAFLANTSHELRTPLNGLIGLARMAQADDLEPSLRRDYLDQIVDGAQALAGIVSDILDLSKIEAGKLALEQRAFDLGLVLRSLHALYAAQAASSGLELRLEMAPEVEGVVLGDALRLRQIAGNYLANAIKFTHTGHIRLGVARLPEPDADCIQLTVHDTGPGIDEATQARLFQPFMQADDSITRRYGGTGLGLAICRELATLMGGRVGVRSVPGDGSEFWAELPLPRSSQSPPVAPSNPFEASGLEGARVLVVEDNPVNMLIGVAMLERWRVVVSQARDGREALATIQAAADLGQPFDVVLMDVQMPVMGGHEATRALRTTEAGRTLPVVALTAAALVAEREEALKAGMDDFLTKPIDAERLHATLLRWRHADRQ